ncbi:MAG: hypothetical protein HYY20_01700 [Candidatus Tectomicrobia bacterium]|uniref:Phospholipase/carboxylesterase/thioesterase domain-containing protein n=1 Tax=Tectimicrobiota bacterium TaxID=2528274 RepID=A0A932CLL4_UNCTE|nr:hypothetical protein [Candidatus Tectomicrobia bacterium]
MMGGSDYSRAIEELARTALDYLWDMEATLEAFHLHELPKYQAPIAAKYRQQIQENDDRLAQLQPPVGREAFHESFRLAHSHLNESCRIFSYPFPSEDFIPCIRGSYHELCLARHHLYDLRRQLPAFDAYWITEDEQPHREQIEVEPDPALEVPVGLLYKDWEPYPPRYTLYVPESYRPDREWPLIVAMHGGGGNDNDFIWLWLRQARSKGYLLVAPKSMDLTWTPKDIRVVLMAIEEVRSIYRINPKGIFLTGVSDGGTFSYEVGLRHPELFAAIAPVAGGLMPWFDFEKARGLPVYILHGSLDWMAPVVFARQAKAILEQFGYRVVYREIPDWGHAMPFSKVDGICAFFGEILQE